MRHVGFRVLLVLYHYLCYKNDIIMYDQSSSYPVVSNLLHCVALIRSTSVTNQFLLSENLQVGQIERGVFQEETSARNAKNTLLIAKPVS